MPRHQLQVSLCLCCRSQRCEQLSSPLRQTSFLPLLIERYLCNAKLSQPAVAAAAPAPPLQPILRKFCGKEEGVIVHRGVVLLGRTLRLGNSQSFASEGPGMSLITQKVSIGRRHRNSEPDDALFWAFLNPLFGELVVCT